METKQPNTIVAVKVTGTGTTYSYSKQRIVNAKASEWEAKTVKGQHNEIIINK
jgi:hypothetical protein